MRKLFSLIEYHANRTLDRYAAEEFNDALREAREELAELRATVRSLDARISQQTGD